MPTHLHPFRIVQPRSIAEAAALLTDDPDAVAYAGGTELLLAMKQAGLRYGSLVDLKTIPDLERIDRDVGERPGVDPEVGPFGGRRPIVGERERRERALR